ncbi:MAG TPA: carbohydrate kinase family protein [Anaerolineales bacterium]|nr:carbohydrate kinase family protein [Anaerolineales bacterium]
MNVVLTGSVAYDYLMTFPGQFRDHILPEKLETLSLSFLVESMVRLRGGNAPNIAYTLAMLGERPRLFATVGEDFEEYRHWLDSKGVDTTWAQVVPGVFTASFFANTDRTNAQIASFYPGAMAFAANLSLKNLEGDLPDLVVISPNDPQAMVRYVDECLELGLPYFYDPSQQIVRLEKQSLRKGIEGAQALFVNEYEFALIQKLTGMTKADIHDRVKLLVVTLGEQGVSISGASEEFHIPVVPAERIADPTGVGDAFRGGFIKAYGHGMDWETCGRVGVLAATYCLENQGPQGHHYTPIEFVSRFRRHFDDDGILDTLLGLHG